MFCITSIPFSLALIASTYDQDEILFFLILLYCHLNLCHWYRYVAPYHPIPPIAVYCAIKYINALFI